MPKILVSLDTWLKSRPVDSSTLYDTEKIFYKAGTSFYATVVTPVGNSHLKLQLASKLKAADGKTDLETVYAYSPHVKIEGPDIEEIIFPIKWDAQSNSRVPGQGPRMCFSSSVWMAVSYISADFAKRFKSDDDYLQHMLKYGDTTQYTAHVAALRAVGIKSQFTTNGILGDIVESLEKGLPCCLGILHKGPVDRPTGGGHWICIGGVNKKRTNYLAFDPWGSVLDKHGPYTGPVENGNGYWLPDFVLDRRWTVDTDQDGWMMTFYNN